MAAKILPGRKAMSNLVDVVQQLQKETGAKGKNGLTKKPPFGGKADHDDRCRYAEKLLTTRRIFGPLVDAVMT